MREYKEVRMRFQGNPELSRQYIGEGRKQLGILKNGMQLGQITQNVRQRTLADGTVVRVQSVNGQDTISIDTRKTVVGGGESYTLLAPQEPEIEYFYSGMLGNPIALQPAPTMLNRQVDLPTAYKLRREWRAGWRTDGNADWDVVLVRNGVDVGRVTGSARTSGGITDELDMPSYASSNDIDFSGALGIGTLVSRSSTAAWERSFSAWRVQINEAYSLPFGHRVDAGITSQQYTGVVFEDGSRYIRPFFTSPEFGPSLLDSAWWTGSIRTIYDLVGGSVANKWEEGAPIEVGLPDNIDMPLGVEAYTSFTAIAIPQVVVPVEIRLEFSVLLGDNSLSSTFPDDVVRVGQVAGVVVVLYAIGTHLSDLDMYGARSHITQFLQGFNDAIGVVFRPARMRCTARLFDALQGGDFSSAAGRLGVRNQHPVSNRLGASAELTATAEVRSLPAGGGFAYRYRYDTTVSVTGGMTDYWTATNEGSPLGSSRWGIFSQVAIPHFGVFPSAVVDMPLAAPSFADATRYSAFGSCTRQYIGSNISAVFFAASSGQKYECWGGFPAPIYQMYRRTSSRVYGAGGSSDQYLDPYFLHGERVEVIPLEVVHSVYGELGVFPLPIDTRPWEVPRLTQQARRGFMYEYDYVSAAWSLVATRTFPEPISTPYNANRNVIFRSVVKQSQQWPDVRQTYEAQMARLQPENESDWDATEQLYAALKNL